MNFMFSLQESGCEILNDKRNFTLEEYRQMFKEQLQVELNGTVKIKSIEKISDDDVNVLLYVSLYETTDYYVQHDHRNGFN